MLTVLGYLCGFLLLGAAVLVGVSVLLRRRYGRSPEKRWSDQVLQVLEASQAYVEREDAACQRAAERLEREEKELRENVLLPYLNRISVAELEAYSGIGPVTVARLREGGFATLAALWSAPVTLPGLGEKRLRDVKKAVRHLVRQAQSRFEAGNLPGAREFAAQREALLLRHREQEGRARARLQAALEVARRLEPLAGSALAVTFDAYLQKRIDPKVYRFLGRKLPDLEQAVRAADEQAQRDFRAQFGSVPSDQAAAPGFPEPTPSPAVTRSAAGATAEKGDVFLQALQTPPLAEGTAGKAESAVDSPSALLELTVQLAFAVARADGRLARKEREVIDAYLRSRCGEDPALLNRALALAAHYETAAIDVDACLWQVRALAADADRRALLGFVTEVADASGGRNDRETALLERVAGKLGLSVASPAAAPPKEPEPAAAPDAASGPASPQDPYAVLEIDPATPLTPDLIRRQYNLLDERFAPEKFAAVGPDFVALANQKREAVRRAAAALLEPLGEALERAPPDAGPKDLRPNPDLDALFGV
jgi:uncharacterized tellurite resistance protein B-like protein